MYMDFTNENLFELTPSKFLLLHQSTSLLWKLNFNYLHFFQPAASQHYNLRLSCYWLKEM